MTDIQLLTDKMTHTHYRCGHSDFVKAKENGMYVQRLACMHCADYLDPSEKTKCPYWKPSKAIQDLRTGNLHGNQRSILIEILQDRKRRGTY